MHINEALVSNKWNFKKLILTIYDSVLMHVKLNEDNISCRGVIVL